jgi:hypothetical protein
MPKRQREIKYFPERPFLYSWEEYMLWRTGDKGFIGSFLDICGTMGQKEKTLKGPQTKRGHHYPEVKYAVHCVQNKSFEPKYIFYEKYRLSQQFIDSIAGETTDDAKLFREAHSFLSKVFSDEFFKKFDELIKLNKIDRDNNLKISVDLCAIIHNKRQVHFIEIKKINHGESQHEGVKQDQLLFLSFVRHLIDILGEKAFFKETYAVITELIVFVPKQDCSRLVNRLQEHYVPLIV